MAGRGSFIPDTPATYAQASGDTPAEPAFSDLRTALDFRYDTWRQLRASRSRPRRLSCSCSLPVRSDADTGLESNDEAEVSVLFADGVEDTPQQCKPENGANCEVETEVSLWSCGAEAIEPCSPCNSTSAGDIDLRIFSDGLQETFSDEQNALPPASTPSPAEHGDPSAGSAVESTNTASSSGESAMAVDELPQSSCATMASSAPDCGVGHDKVLSSMFYV